MANRRNRDRTSDGNGGRNKVSADDKIARILGLLLVKEIKKKTDQVPLLRRIGFEVSEVAAMLDMSENHVGVADHAGRKKKR
jgi:hypothetical protein